LIAAVTGHDLPSDRAAELMTRVVDGELSDVQVAAFLAALAARGPTPDELAGFARPLLARMIPLPEVPAGAIDTCGTGGSGLPTLNTSTLAAFVAAGAGVPVAKHGNRSASGRCGSLDVLEALGANVELDPDAVSALLRRSGFTFANARAHHPALGRLGPLRKALGFRTVFNLLGPMLSPARVRRQLLGVSDPRLAPVMAGALARLGRERAWIVAGPGGLDEIGLHGVTAVWKVEGSKLTEDRIDPAALGLGGDPVEIRGGDVEANARRFVAVLAGEDRGAARDHVALNAGAALVVAGAAEDLARGLELARATLDGGAALRCFEAWRDATRAPAPPPPSESAEVHP
jgi:anthranilate phosphoribosyltransferase